MAEAYGETVNHELLRFIGSLRGTVLDVGCGRGAWAPDLRRLGATRLAGLEPSDDARFAAERYDAMLVDPVEHADLPTVDAVIAADVLEHLADPWAALRKLRTAVVDGAPLYVSVPNAQFIKAIWTLTRGHFPYEDGGYWDRTHLRWFTAKSLSQVFGETGWEVKRTGFVTGSGIRGRLAAVVGAARPLLGHQLQVHAVAASLAIRSTEDGS